MGIEFTNNFDQIAKQIHTEVSDATHEALAEQVATTAREHGLSNADGIALEIDEDTEVEIDAERVRARANEILATD